MVKQTGKQVSNHNSIIGGGREEAEDSVGTGRERGSGSEEAREDFLEEEGK